MRFIGHAGLALLIAGGAGPALAKCSDELPPLEQLLTDSTQESNPALGDAMLAFERAAALCDAGDDVAAVALIDKVWTLLNEGGRS